AITVEGGVSANYTFTYISGVLTIGKADASIALDDLAPAYDGSPKSVTATTTPAGLPLTITYDGSAIPPSAPGSYAIVATINDANYEGRANGTLTIGKAPVTIALGDLTATYDGTAKAVSV